MIINRATLDKLITDAYAVHRDLSAELDRIGDANTLEWQQLYGVFQAIGSATTTLSTLRKQTSQCAPDTVHVNGTAYHKQPF